MISVDGGGKLTIMEGGCEHGVEMVLFGTVGRKGEEHYVLLVAGRFEVGEVCIGV